MGGRATALRNIFGSDPDTLAQSLGVARGSLPAERPAGGLRPRLAHPDLGPSRVHVHDRRQPPGRRRPQVRADAVDPPGRRTARCCSIGGSTPTSNGATARSSSVPTSCCRGDGSRSTSSRFSPGDFPAMYDPLHDRESAFAAAEYDVWSRVRLFGGWEGSRTNIDPDLSLHASANARRAPPCLAGSAACACSSARARP